MDFADDYPTVNAKIELVYIYILELKWIHHQRSVVCSFQ